MGYCESLEARLLLASVLASDLSPPIPRTSGPYIVGIYSSRQLDASSSTDPDPGESLSFAWDLDNDNIYGETGAAAANGDEIGATPTFFVNATPIGTYSIKLRVADSSGLSSDLTTSISVRDYILNGTAGNDSWRILMTPSSIVDFYENSPLGAPPTFSIPFNRVGFIRVVAGDGDDTVEMNYPFPCNQQFGAGNDTYVFSGGAGWTDVGQSSLENLVVSGSASFDFRRISYRFSSITIAGSGKVSLTGTNTYLHLGSLSITDSARLELTQNTLIVDSANISEITNLIKNGRIVDLNFFEVRRPGAIQNSNGANGALYTNFAGETNLAGNEILIRYRLAGDVNLDGAVSIADFIQLASHFGQTPATWGDGDTDFDNAVTIADFIVLAARFGSGAPAPAMAEAPLSITASPASRKARHHRAKARHHADLPQKQPQLILLSRRLAEKR